jgi:hypothetical protein
MLTVDLVAGCFVILGGARILEIKFAVGFSLVLVFLQRPTITFLRSAIYCLSSKFSCSRLKFGD